MVHISRRTFLRGLSAAGAATLAAHSTIPVLRRTASAAHVNENPAEVGHWDTEKKPISTPLVGIHASLLHTGHVLLIQGGHGVTQSKVYLWNPPPIPPNGQPPESGTFEQKALPDGANVFCAGHASLPDGKLFVAGGHKSDLTGSPRCHAFDPVSKEWTRLADMRQARWYPTCTVLPSGKVLVVSGSVRRGLINEDVEVYDPVDKVWALLTGATWKQPPLYPFMFALGSGKVLNAGPKKKNRLLDVSGVGLWESTPYELVTDDLKQEDTPAVTLVDLVAGKQKVLVSGGKSGSKTSQWITFGLNGVGDSWHETNPMQHERLSHNLILLPTGDVLATGGTDGGGNSVLAAELFNPNTATWTQMASMWQGRRHHSTGFLLPDGRVVVTGTDNDKTLEIYSPPYLHQGTRPSMSSVPTSMAYGGSITFPVSVSGSIDRVSLIRPSAVTHSYDQDQRYLRLAFKQNGDTLTVDAPTNANQAPPGYYMLFVVDSNNVPSTAAWIKLA